MTRPVVKGSKFKQSETCVRFNARRLNGKVMETRSFHLRIINGGDTWSLDHTLPPLSQRASLPFVILELPGER